MTDLTAEKIWEAADKAKADRAEAMPTEQDALNALQKAYQRLRDLGWRDAIYCPKDRKIFDAIEVGSTGVFKEAGGFMTPVTYGLAVRSCFES